ncbi:unnamed protein product [Mytilus coruscus]|uniref:Uncharacterized protein n=1 Tax=Mytilus coruscus TaxID=42192 RepID=A0A6J8AWX0_MYTCO|nr:unnamed protein product [Mytilus coruscus]
MKRARKDNKDIYMSILDFCNTQTDGMSSSPSQRLMCRRTKTRLPTSWSLLKPYIPLSATQNARDLQELERGQCVWISPKPNDRTKTWTKGIRRKVDIRSYEVYTDQGQKLRRNRRDIRISRGTNRQSDNYVMPNDIDFNPYRVPEDSLYELNTDNRNRQNQNTDNTPIITRGETWNLVSVNPMLIVIRPTSRLEIHYLPIPDPEDK